MARVSLGVRQLVAAAKEKYSPPSEANEDVVNDGAGARRAICKTLAEAAALAAACESVRAVEFIHAAGFVLPNDDNDDIFGAKS